MVLAATLSIAALAFAAVHAESILYCGTQPYYLSQYTCYDNEFLCPVIQGERTLNCASACYLKEAYVCNNGQLAMHPEATHAFRMVARNSIRGINGRHVNACGLHYHIGQGSCQYCPEMAGSICWDVSNTTIITASGALDVVVPGGQMSFIETDGAFGFTEAHSASMPSGATFGFDGFEQGYFVYTAAPNWLACPDPNAAGVYQVFADLPGVTYGESCVGLNIVTENVASGEFGAWEYV